MADSRKRHFAKTGNDRIDENFRRIAGQFNWLDIATELPTASQEFFGHEFILHTPSGGIPYICLKDAGLSNYTWTPYKGGVYAGPFGPLIWPTDPFLKVRDKLEDKDVANKTQAHFDTTYAECQKINLSSICPVASLDLVGVKWKHATATGDKFVICTYDANYTPYWLGPITPVNTNTFPPDVPDDQPTEDPDYGNPMLVIDPFEPDTCEIWDKEAEGNVRGLTDEDHLLQGESSMRISKCIEIDDFDGDENGDPEWTVLDSNGIAQDEEGYTTASCEITQDTNTKFSGESSLKVSPIATEGVVYIAHSSTVDGSDDVWNIYRLSKDDGSTVWSQTTTFPQIVGTHQINTEVLAMCTDDTYVYTAGFNSCETDDFEDLITHSWVEKRSKADGTLQWGVINTQDSAYFGTYYDFKITNIRVDDDGIYITEDRKIVSTGGDQFKLFKLSKADGSQVWDVVLTPTGGVTFKTMDTDDTHIYINSRNTLYKHAKSDGSQTWNASTGYTSGSPSIDVFDGFIYITAGTNLDKRSITDGSVIWNKTAGADGQVAVTSNNIFVYGYDGTLYSYDTSGVAVTNTSLAVHNNDRFNRHLESTSGYTYTISGKFASDIVITSSDPTSLATNWSQSFVTSGFGHYTVATEVGTDPTSDNLVITRTFDSSTDNTNLSDEILERIKIKSTFSDINLTLETTDTEGGVQSKTWNILANSTFEEFTWDISGIENDDKSSLSSAKVTIEFNTDPSGGQAVWLDIWEACPGDTPEGESHRLHRRWSTAFNLSQYQSIKVYVRGPATDTDGNALILGRLGVQWGNGTAYYDLQNVDGTEWYLVTIPITDDNRSHGNSVFQFEFVPPTGEDEFPEGFNVEFMYALPQP